MPPEDEGTLAEALAKAVQKTTEDMKKIGDAMTGAVGAMKPEYNKAGYHSPVNPAYVYFFGDEAPVLSGYAYTMWVNTKTKTHHKGTPLGGGFAPEPYQHVLQEGSPTHNSGSLGVPATSTADGVDGPMMWTGKLWQKMEPVDGIPMPAPKAFKEYVYLDRTYVVGEGKPTMALLNIHTKFYWVDLDACVVWENHTEKGWAKLSNCNVYDADVPSHDAKAGDVLWDGKKFFVRGGGQWNPTKQTATTYPENVAKEQAKKGVELKFADAVEETAKPAKLYEGFGRTYIVGEGTPSLIVKNTVGNVFWWLDTEGGKLYRNGLHGWSSSKSAVYIGMPEGSLTAGAIWIDKAGDIYLRLDTKWNPLTETGVIYPGGKPQTVKGDITVNIEKEAVVPEAKPVVELRKYDGGKKVPRVYYVGDTKPLSVPAEGEKKIYWVDTKDNSIHKLNGSGWEPTTYYKVVPKVGDESADDGDVVLGNGEITVFKWGEWTKLESVPMTGVTVEEPKVAEIAADGAEPKIAMFKSAPGFGWKPTIVYVSTGEPDESVTYTNGHFTFWANPATGVVHECPPMGWKKTKYKAVYNDSTAEGDYWVNVSKDHKNAEQYYNGKWKTLSLIGTTAPDEDAAEPADGVQMYKAEGEVIQYYVAPFGPEQYTGIGKDVQYFAQYWLNTKNWKLYYWTPQDNAWYHAQWKVYTLPAAAYADPALGNVLYKDGELFLGTGNKYKGTTEYAVHPAHLSKAPEAKPVKISAEPLAETAHIGKPKTEYVDKTLVQKFYHATTKTLAYIAGFGPEHVQDNIYMAEGLLKKVAVHWIDNSTKQVWLRNEDGKWQKSERVFRFDHTVTPAVGDFLMHYSELEVCVTKNGGYTTMHKEMVGTDSLIVTAENMLAEPAPEPVKPVKQEVKKYQRSGTEQTYWIGACAPLSAAEKTGNYWVNNEAKTIHRWFATKKAWVKAETSKGIAVIATSLMSGGKPGDVCISHGTVYSWEKNKWAAMELLDTISVEVKVEPVAAEPEKPAHGVDLSCHDEGNVYTGEYGKLSGHTYYVKAGLPVPEAGGKGHVWVGTTSMMVWHWSEALSEWVLTKHTAHAKKSGGGVPGSGESGDGDVLVTNEKGVIWVRDGGSWYGAVREDVPFPGVPAEAGNMTACMTVCVHPTKPGRVYYIGTFEPTPEQEHDGAFWVDVKGGEVKRWNGLTNLWVLVAGYYAEAEPSEDALAGSVKWVSSALGVKGFYVKVSGVSGGDWKKMSGVSGDDWKKMSAKPQGKTEGPVPGMLTYKHPTKNRTYHFTLGKPQSKYAGPGAYWVDTNTKTIYAWSEYNHYWEKLKSAAYTLEDGELPAKAVPGSVACLTSGPGSKMFVRVAGEGWMEMTALDGTEQPAETVKEPADEPAMVEMYKGAHMKAGQVTIYVGLGAPEFLPEKNGLTFYADPSTGQVWEMTAKEWMLTPYKSGYDLALQGTAGTWNISVDPKAKLVEMYFGGWDSLAYEGYSTIPVKKAEKEEKEEKKAAAGAQYFTPVGAGGLSRVYIISHEKPEPLSHAKMGALEKSKQYWVDLTNSVIMALDWTSSWVPSGKDTLYTGTTAILAARNLWVHSKDGAVKLAFVHHNGDWFAMTEIDPGTGKKVSAPAEVRKFEGQTSLGKSLTVYAAASEPMKGTEPGKYITFWADPATGKVWETGTGEKWKLQGGYVAGYDLHTEDYPWGSKPKDWTVSVASDKSGVWIYRGTEEKWVPLALVSVTQKLEGGGTLTVPAGALADAAAVKEKPVLSYTFKNGQRFHVGTLKQRDEFTMPEGWSTHYWVNRVGLCVYLWEAPGKWKKLDGVKVLDGLDGAKTSVTEWTFCLDEPMLHVHNSKEWFHLQPEPEAAKTVKTAVWPGGIKILMTTVDGYKVKLYLSADEPENVPFESGVIQQWVNPVTGEKHQKSSASGAKTWVKIDNTIHPHIKLDAVADGEGADFQYSTDEDYGLIYVSHDGKWYKMEPVSEMTQSWVVWRYNKDGGGGMSSLYILKSQDPPAEDVLPNEDCLKFWVNTDTEVIHRWSASGGKWSKTAMPYFPEGKGGITEKDWAVRWYEGSAWVMLPVPAAGWKKLKSDTAMGITGGAPVVPEPEPTVQDLKQAYKDYFYSGGKGHGKNAVKEEWLKKMLLDEPVTVPAAEPPYPAGPMGLPLFTAQKGGMKYLWPTTTTTNFTVQDQAAAKLMASGPVTAAKPIKKMTVGGEVADVLTVNGTKYFKEGTGPLEGGGGSAGLEGGAKPKGSVLDHKGASADAVAEGATLEPGDVIMIGAGEHVGKIVSVGKVTYLNDGKYYVAFKVEGAWFSEHPHKLVLLEKGLKSKVF